MNNHFVDRFKDADIERRCISGQIRVSSMGSERPRIFGYAAKYNELSQVLGNFREQIAPGFFDGIQSFDVRALMNHDPNFVLGRAKAGTLKLYPDSIGLRVEITPPDSQWASDLIVSMQRGDIDQMSFAFIMPKKGGDRWEKVLADEDGIEWLRTLIKPRAILDVSIVTYPAYPQTSATVDRKLEQIKARMLARKRRIQILELSTPGRALLKIHHEMRKRRIRLLGL